MIAVEDWKAKLLEIRDQMLRRRHDKSDQVLAVMNDQYARLIEEGAFKWRGVPEGNRVGVVRNTIWIDRHFWCLPQCIHLEDNGFSCAYLVNLPFLIRHPILGLRIDLIEAFMNTFLSRRGHLFRLHVGSSISNLLTNNGDVYIEDDTLYCLLTDKLTIGSKTLISDPEGGYCYVPLLPVTMVEHVGWRTENWGSLSMKTV